MKCSSHRKSPPGWMTVATGSLLLLLADVAGADFSIGPFEIEPWEAEIWFDPFWPPPPIGYPPRKDAYAEAEASGATIAPPAAISRVPMAETSRPHFFR